MLKYEVMGDKAMKQVGKLIVYFINGISFIQLWRICARFLFLSSFSFWEVSSLFEKLPDWLSPVWGPITWELLKKRSIFSFWEDQWESLLTWGRSDNDWFPREWVISFCKLTNVWNVLCVEAITYTFNNFREKKHIFSARCRKTQDKSLVFSHIHVKNSILYWNFDLKS